MELQEIRERIEDTSLVQSLPAAMSQRFVAALLGIAETQSVSRQHKLFKLGEKNTDTGCVILEGMVKVETESGDVKHIEAPDILGEVQLFTPGGKRTATVEVVVGGAVLLFPWKKLGDAAKAEFTEEEFEKLKAAITKSAWRREENIFEKLKK